MRLIPDASLAWRFGSVQVAVLLALLSGIQAEVLPLVSPLFPPEVWPWVSGALALAVVLLRLVAQPALAPQRQLLQLQHEHAQFASSVVHPSAQAAADLADQAVEGLAVHLYTASRPSKPWAQVSEPSKARWRQVAAAAHAYAVDSLGGT